MYSEKWGRQMNRMKRLQVPISCLWMKPVWLIKWRRLLCLEFLRSLSSLWLLVGRGELADADLVLDVDEFLLPLFGAKAEGGLLPGIESRRRNGCLLSLATKAC